MAASSNSHIPSTTLSPPEPLIASNDVAPPPAPNTSTPPAAPEPPPLTTPSTPNETKAPPSSPPASLRTRLRYSISSLSDHKIELTLSKLTLSVSIVALIVSLLSYSYGASSFRVAEKAFELQQLEFCKDHGDDPRILNSKHYQKWMTKPVDAIVGRRRPSVPKTPGEVEDVQRGTSVGLKAPDVELEVEVDGTIDTCPSPDLFKSKHESRPRLQSRGLSRNTNVAEP